MQAWLPQELMTFVDCWQSVDAVCDGPRRTMSLIATPSRNWYAIEVWTVPQVRTSPNIESYPNQSGAMVNWEFHHPFSADWHRMAVMDFNDD